ncbi:serine hydrolase domain-containing protein [Maribacter antarcticus]|uniref:serine hydrolase domain-containing protein n=1 Tax=Maribacter antarcticus TaxID=505250 RepID=UPI00047EBBCB|nr:serine hydrolase domain-containing protein [Maribacter antarcticus]
MKTIKYSILILIISSCSKDNDNSINVTSEESLTQRLQQIFEQSDLPGFTVGLVNNGNAVYQNSFGFQDIENNIEYSNQTLQPIGSISKTFIGVAVVKAIELGYFNLETPINDILTEPLINPKNPLAEIRIRHLVNHTSGLINPVSTYALSYYILMGENTASDGAQILQNYGITQRNPKTLAQFIDAYFYEGGDYYSLDNFTNNTLGEIESYSDTGSSLMALLIEIASSMSYQDFLKTHIFKPLGMNNTSFEYNLPNDNYASLYFDKSTPFPLYNLESFPDGSLKTSNEDLMKYLLNMMAGQRGETTLLFDSAFYNLLFTNTTETYAIFWDVLGENTFGHTGSDPGLGTTLSFSGTLNQGAFILSNFDSTDLVNEEYLDEIFEQISESLEMFLSN